MRVKNIGGTEYHVAVRPWQGGGCGKGDVLSPTQSTRKILLVYTKKKQSERIGALVKQLYCIHYLLHQGLALCGHTIRVI